MFSLNTKNRKYDVKRITQALICLGLAIGLLAVAADTDWAVAQSGVIGVADADRAELNLSPDHLIRFHVIANSDSAEDQALKYAVRDAVLKQVAPRLAQSRSLAESRAIILEQQSELVRVATAVVQDWHKDYSVAFDYGMHTFPAKSYGTIVLPGGEYEAVKIKIGQAGGANWWCVLFPPLCFVNVEESTAVPVDGQAGIPIDSVRKPETGADSAVDSISGDMPVSGGESVSGDTSVNGDAPDGDDTSGLRYKGKKVGFYFERFF